MVKKEGRNKGLKVILIFVGVIILALIVLKMMFYYNNSTEAIAQNLTWSSDQGAMSWDNATATCSDLGSRLPNKNELVAALSDQFFNGGSSPGGFQQDTKYWSSSKEIIGELYITAFYNIKGDLITHSGKKKFEYSVRCVK